MLQTQFNASGEIFLTKTAENKIIAFFTSTMRSIEIPISQHNNGSISVIRITKEIQGNYYAFLGFNDGNLSVFDILNKKLLFKKKYFNEQIIEIQFSYKTETFYLVSKDKTMLQIDFNSKQVLFTLQLPLKTNFENCEMIISEKNNKILLSCEKKVYLISENQIKKKYEAHSKPIKLLKKSLNSKLFLTFSNEKIIKIYNMKQENAIFHLKITKNNVKNIGMMKISSTEHFVYCQTDENIYFWLLGISMTKNYILPEIYDIFQINYNVINSILNEKKEILICEGHYLNPNFKFFNCIKFDEMGRGRIDRDVISEILKFQDSNKKINESYSKEIENIAHILGEKDVIFNKKIKKNGLKLNQIEEIKKFLPQPNQNENIVDSLSIHLVQSLQNNDISSITACLDTSDLNIINNTIKTMDKTYIFQLTDQIVSLISAFPQKKAVLLIWLQFILKYNFVYFLSVSSFEEKFSKLFSLLTKNTKHIENLKKLQYKIIAIQSLKNLNSNNPQKKVKIDVPIMIYEEKDEEIIENVIEEEEIQPEKGFDDSISELSEDKDFKMALKSDKNQQLEDDEMIEI